ncbi:deoxyribodipyrimidine photo-lyase [Photobacterium sp. 1_MG-2023]|uniref:deoxyribodipyrimidine photo-lyase n=1 Tax=Photobacterium sp. 1_MG-2023 TaxID=3062646 RepID=UPI0026E2FCEC|nr:deoxyribodipyrimidine photo-lyase [Photobacterium sp. 1_MG-2023]MDO6706966.1 deoxyribodipyrimidine photo-lyase [Photobacterium sp. 1_MG-2023]
MTKTESANSMMWFRADLRVVDNTALLQASKQKKPVFAVFFATPEQWASHDTAPIQIDLIRRRLRSLQTQLSECNIPLRIEQVADFEALPAAIAALAEAWSCDHVFCNKQYEWNEKLRDQAVGQALKKQKIKFSVFEDTCVLPAGSVLTRQGDPFKVYTPFRREWLNQFHLSPALAQPAPAAQAHDAEHMKFATPPSDEQVDRWMGYALRDSSDWPVGEEDIRARLIRFCVEKVQDYGEHRDLPAVDGTSGLSPYLAIGAVSARQCLSAVLHEFPEAFEKQEQGPFIWLNEIIWREFYRHLIDAYPQVSRAQPFVNWTRQVDWQWDQSALERWQNGETGFPIVDAAMRQLKATGWMHNRLRMITASFLTKDLLIHWQAGEQWFMSQLIDGDLASNNGGWQWAASTGTDAQPYFRVFNPTAQGKKFDPNGEFIRTWVKELAEVPDKYIHNPYDWPDVKSLDYPPPMVDHKAARVKAIEAFKQAKALTEQA